MFPFRYSQWHQKQLSDDGDYCGTRTSDPGLNAKKFDPRFARWHLSPIFLEGHLL